MEVVAMFWPPVSYIFWYGDGGKMNEKKKKKPPSLAPLPPVVVRVRSASTH